MHHYASNSLAKLYLHHHSVDDIRKTHFFQFSITHLYPEDTNTYTNVSRRRDGKIHAVKNLEWSKTLTQS